MTENEEKLLKALEQAIYSAEILIEAAHRKNIMQMRDGLFEQYIKAGSQWEGIKEFAKQERAKQESEKQGNIEKKGE